nr:MAG TPA: hypothetical protein [Caudoviricetes sp.]
MSATFKLSSLRTAYYTIALLSANFSTPRPQRN